MKYGLENPEPVRQPNGTPGDPWGTMYHATRATSIDRILSEGLLPWRPYGEGFMKISAGVGAWHDLIYGLPPVFLFTTPETPGNYSLGYDDETPVWLQVDTHGLTLVADLWQLRETTEAVICDQGLWWDSPVTFRPDPEQVPEPLKPFQENGLVSYQKLMNEAAEAAIQTSKSAAVLSTIDHSKIQLLQTP